MHRMSPPPKKVTFCSRVGLTIPVIQAPMAGVSTPALAAAVSTSGGLGSIAVGASTTAEAARMIDEVRHLTDRPFNVNVFCHQAASPASARDDAWRGRFTDLFTQFAGTAPESLR